KSKVWLEANAIESDREQLCNNRKRVETRRIQKDQAREAREARERFKREHGLEDTEDQERGGERDRGVTLGQGVIVEEVSVGSEDDATIYAPAPLDFALEERGREGGIGGERRKPRSLAVSVSTSPTGEQQSTSLVPIGDTATLGYAQSNALGAVNRALVGDGAGPDVGIFFSGSITVPSLSRPRTAHPNRLLSAGVEGSGMLSSKPSPVPFVTPAPSPLARRNRQREGEGERERERERDSLSRSEDTPPLTPTLMSHSASAQSVHSVVGTQTQNMAQEKMMLSAIHKMYNINASRNRRVHLLMLYLLERCLLSEGKPRSDIQHILTFLADLRVGQLFDRDAVHNTELNSRKVLSDSMQREFGALLDMYAAETQSLEGGPASATARRDYDKPDWGKGERKEDSADERHMIERVVRAFFSERRQGSQAPQNSGSRYSKDFTEIRMLGEGGFGKVVAAHHIIERRDYAIKMVPIKHDKWELTKEETQLRMSREVAALSLIHSPYVVRYYACWIEDQKIVIDDDEDGVSRLGDTRNTAVYSVNDLNELPDVDSLGRPYGGTARGDSMLMCDSMGMDSHPFRNAGIGRGARPKVLGPMGAGRERDLTRERAQMRERGRDRERPFAPFDSDSESESDDYSAPRPLAPFRPIGHQLGYSVDSDGEKDNENLGWTDASESEGLDDTCTPSGACTPSLMDEGFGDSALGLPFAGALPLGTDETEWQDMARGSDDSEGGEMVFANDLNEPYEPSPVDLDRDTTDESEYTLGEGKEKSTTMLYIQMELCDPHTLRDAIDKRTLGQEPHERWRICRQMAEGLADIHSAKMIHRDLKPENIFLTSIGHNVKIGDLGLSRAITDEGLALPEDRSTADTPQTHVSESPMLRGLDRLDRMASPGVSPMGKASPAADKAQKKKANLTTGVGTVAYMAPELQGGTNTGTYDGKVDIYALGIIFLEVWYMFSTYMHRVNVLENLRISHTLPEEFENNCPSQAYLIKWCTHEDPKKRPTITELLMDTHLPLIDVEVVQTATRAVESPFCPPELKRGMVSAVFRSCLGDEKDEETELQEQAIDMCPTVSHHGDDMDSPDTHMGQRTTEEETCFYQMDVVAHTRRHMELAGAVPHPLPTHVCHMQEHLRSVPLLLENGSLVHAPLNPAVLCAARMNDTHVSHRAVPLTRYSITEMCSANREMLASLDVYRPIHRWYSATSPSSCDSPSDTGSMSPAAVSAGILSVSEAIASCYDIVRSLPMLVPQNARMVLSLWHPMLPMWLLEAADVRVSDAASVESLECGLSKAVVQRSLECASCHYIKPTILSTLYGGRTVQMCLDDLDRHFTRRDNQPLFGPELSAFMDTI
ncbi:hypothetical protein KIPB_003615, partial [Kipferlia bialata]